MNVGLMQLAPMATSKQVAQNSSAAPTGDKSSSFGEMFNQAISSSSKEANSIDQETAHPVDFEKIEALITSGSVEEFTELLGIQHDEGLFLIQAGEEGQALSVDEMMTLENLLAVLNIKPNELLETLQQLTGVEMTEASDVWQLMENVLQQASEMMQQLSKALRGEHKTTPQQAEQVIQFLKLAQVSGKNSDLLQEQAKTLEQLEQLLKTLQMPQKESAILSTQSRTFDQLAAMLKNSAKEVNQNLPHTMTNVKNEATGSNQVALQNVDQAIQQVVKSVESSQPTQSLDDSSKTAHVAAQPNITAKTITIALPAEKGAQSEALAKEIQNLLNRSQISNTPGTTKLLLKLYPENLGSIRIEIMQQNGVLTARLLTSTAHGKELLDSQLHQLKNAFAQANIQMDRIDITQSLQETDKNNRDQHSFGQQFKQQSSRDEKDQPPHDEEESKTFSEYLINEEV